jgi:hypothetical protein
MCVAGESICRTQRESENVHVAFFFERSGLAVDALLQVGQEGTCLPGVAVIVSPFATQVRVTI